MADPSSITDGDLDSLAARSRSASIATVSKEHFDFGPVLGEGAFGQVRICRKKDTGVTFAAKILRKEQLIKAKQTKYVKSEKAIQSSLSHPFISRLYFTFADAKKLYLIMELVQGGEFFSHIRDVDLHMSMLDVVRFYMAELFVAIEYIHSKGIVHRDLKPENLLLDGSGHLKLVDFGIAKKIDGAGLHTFCGTAEYLAPEVLRNTSYDFAVDWWAFGCIVYEALVGTSPFFASSVTLTYQKIVNREMYWPREMHQDARDLIDGLLCLDAATRLGCNQAKGGTAEIREHPFFKGLQLDRLHEVEPPIRPAIRRAMMAFDPSTAEGDQEEGSSTSSPSAADIAAMHQKTQIMIERYRAKSIISHTDPQQLARAKDVQRRSAMLRDMYPELNRLPPRPPPVPVDVGPAYVTFGQYLNQEVHSQEVPSASSVDNISKDDSNDRTKLVHVKSMSQQKGPIRCLSWDTQGKRLAAAGNFFTTIYAVPDVSESSPFSPSADAVLSSSPSSLSALPASPKLSSAMSSVSLGAWEEYNGEAGSSSSFLEFSPSGQLFAFDLQRRIGLCTMTESGRGDTKFEVSHLSGHNMPVSAIAWSPDSEYLASGGMDQQLFIWSVGRKRFVQKLKGHVSYIAAVAWSRDAVVSGGGDAKLVFFDPLVGRIKNHVDYHKGAILALDWRPKDQILASTSVDRKVLFMDTRSWAASNVLVFPAAPSRVSFSPDGSYFATSGKDAVRVWSFAEMRQIAIFRGDQVTGSPMSWSSTGRWFATVDDRNLPVVFDMQQFRTIRTRPSSSTKVPDTEPIVSLRWCPRSDMLAVGALDRVVSFWMPRLV